MGHNVPTVKFTLFNGSPASFLYSPASFGLIFFFFFLAVLKFELRTSCLLGLHSASPIPTNFDKCIQPHIHYPNQDTEQWSFSVAISNP
jgi:hypothetical protein